MNERFKKMCGESYITIPIFMWTVKTSRDIAKTNSSAHKNTH